MHAGGPHTLIMDRINITCHLNIWVPFWDWFRSCYYKRMSRKSNLLTSTQIKDALDAIWMKAIATYRRKSPETNLLTCMQIEDTYKSKLSFTSIHPFVEIEILRVQIYTKWPSQSTGIYFACNIICTQMILAKALCEKYYTPISRIGNLVKSLITGLSPLININGSYRRLGGGERLRTGPRILEGEGLLKNRLVNILKYFVW